MAVAAAEVCPLPVVVTLLGDDVVFAILDTGEAAPAPSRTRLLRRLWRLDLPAACKFNLYLNYKIF